jgi:hypothetical protein
MQIAAPYVPCDARSAAQIQSVWLAPTFTTSALMTVSSAARPQGCPNVLTAPPPLFATPVSLVTSSPHKELAPCAPLAASSASEAPLPLAGTVLMATSSRIPPAQSAVLSARPAISSTSTVLAALPVSTRHLSAHPALSRALFAPRTAFASPVCQATTFSRRATANPAWHPARPALGRRPA